MPLSSHVNLMPYVIQYILMQHGIRFKNDKAVMSRNDGLLPATPVEKYQPFVHVQDTVNGIEEKVQDYLRTKD